MVALHVVALLFTIGGSLVVAYEVWSGHNRWVAMFGPKPARALAVSGVASLHLTATGVAGGVVGERTLEERLTALEQQQQADHKMLLDRILGAEQKMPEVAADAARAVENRLRPEIAAVLRYLTGQGDRAWWNPWWLGPALLLIGALLGGVGSVIGAASA